MLKKIIILIVLLFSFYSTGFSAECDFKEGDNVSIAIGDCLSSGNGTSLVNGGANLSVEGEGFKGTVNNWIRAIGGILGLLAIGAIAYGGFTLVVSTGDDEKLKKGKDIVKWGILGFLGVVSASFLITVLVKVIYSIGG